MFAVHFYGHSINNNNNNIHELEFQSPNVD